MTSNSSRRAQVTPSDLHLLECPGSWLNDNIINDYLAVLQTRSQDGPIQVLPLDSFFMRDLIHRRLAVAAKSFKKIDPLNVDLLLVPYHREKQNHWALITAWPKRRIIESYDSLGWSNRLPMYELFNALRWYAVSHDRERSSAAWHLKDTPPSCPLQRNNYDCGVYLLWFAERLARGEQVMLIEPAFTPVQWRQHILSVVSNRRMGFGECVRAERGIPPKRTHTTSSKTQTDPVARKLTKEQASNTEPELASPHPSPKEEIEEEDRPATNPVSSNSPAESLEHLLESLGDAVGPWKPPSVTTLPSPCLSCEANEDWLDQELAAATWDIVAVETPPNPREQASEIDGPLTPCLSCEAPEDWLEAELTAAARDLADEPAPTPREEAKPDPTEESTATGPPAGPSNDRPKRYRPKRKAKPKKMTVLFPWGPMKINEKFLRPELFQGNN